ncbi:MAG: CBS domain-containing protein [Chitinophagales bacterium]
MTRKLIYAKTNNAFSEILQLFLSKNIHHLPIMNDDDELIGIVSSHDVLNALSNLIYRPNQKIDIDNVDEEVKIEDIMTSNPTVISPEETLGNAAIIFATHKFQALPIVDGSGKLQGILTSRDIVNEFAVNR